MFTNLTGKQKTFAVILIILCLVAIVLAIYFGVSKRCPPVSPSKPSLKKFNVSSTTNPWSVPTYYKYSYYDEPNKQEGSQSAPSDKVQSNDSTNPVIQVTANPLYSIKIYRAVNTPPGDYTLLDVIVDASGQFTDTDNPYKPPPYTPPPKPKSKPAFVNWHAGTPPWKTPTFYKYSYYDDKQEGPLSDASDAVSSNIDTNPEFFVTLLSPYNIRIYRAIKDDYSQLEVQVDADGRFTDTANPYTPPAVPPQPALAPVFKRWTPQYM